MGKNTLLSIVVPCFNAEKYIGFCLDSLLDQMSDEYEIICINDGSTDNTEKILKEYSNKSNKVRTYSHNNQGVSATRNWGGYWLMAIGYGLLTQMTILLNIA